MFGNNIINQKNNNQWTTLLGENLVKRTLMRNGYKVRRPICKEHYRPDFETDEYIIEVKTRNWTTSGTAGEKVFGTPYKYSDIPRLYEKPLIIVCVAFQEYEFIHGNTKIFSNNLSPEKKEIYGFI